MNFNKYLEVKPDVAEALAAGRAVVALESTIISHGMPYPKNVETAAAVEQIVRDGGAVPATIAILGGKIKIGLEPDELEFLGTAENVLKASRRDLGHIVANGLNGATTVAATMIAADLGRHQCFCYRRDRGRSPRCRELFRHLGRPAGTFGNRCRGNLRRSQVDSGHRPDP